MQRRTKLLAWLLMACCWVVQALATRHSMNADGISYQNIVDACVQGRWHALVNDYWSPGYPFLLALWTKLFRPSPYNVPLCVRSFGVFSLFVALVAFEYFLKVFFVFRREVAQVEDGGGFLSERSIRIAAYGLFLWVTVFLIPASLEQPDIWVFVVYMLACVLCMKIVAVGGSVRFVLLGIVLGLGYLVKAVMFPLSFVFMLSVAINRGLKRSLPGLTLTLVAFALVSLPFISALSKAKGRFTYGDAGAFNYQQMLGGQKAEASNAGLSAAPHLEDYTAVADGTPYPPWTDPSRVVTSAKYPFNLRRQLNRIHVVLRYYFELYAIQLGSLTCGLLALLLYSWSLVPFFARFFKQVVLWLPAAAGLATYALVRAEGRFLAGFTVALFAAAIGVVQAGKENGGDRVGHSVACAIAAVLVAQALMQVGHARQQATTQKGYPDWQVAQALVSNGLRSGDRVSYLGDALDNHTWAYLAHLSIVAEIPEEDTATFWASTAGERREATLWLARRGVKAIVTRDAPAPAGASDWKKVGETPYSILNLNGAQ